MRGFQRHIESITFLPIPYTNERYLINHKGKIVDYLLNEISVMSGSVRLELLGKERELDISRLILMTFKPMFKAESFILEWDILFIDGERTNLAPSNLLWKPPIKGQPCPEEDRFFVIPGYSISAINRQGDVLDRSNGSIRLFENRTAARYFSLSLKPDVGQRETIPHHRAVAYAFVPYDINVRRMTVNHKSGDKRNNDPDNLEWSTYSDNNIHAMEKGLRPVYEALSVKDHLEDKLLEFKSISECGRYFGNLNTGTIATSVKRGSLFRGRYTLRYKKNVDNGVETHPYFQKDFIHVMIQKHADIQEDITYTAYKPLTKELHITDSMGAMATVVGLTKDDVRTAVNSELIIPYYGYIFAVSYDGNYLIWDFEKDLLEAIGEKKGVRKLIRLTDTKDGHSKFVFSEQESHLLSKQMFKPKKEYLKVEVKDKRYMRKRNWAH